MIQKFRSIIKPFIACALLVYWVGTPAFGLDPIAVLQPSDAKQGFGADFGTGVTINEDWLVIGAPSDYETGVPDAGAAYVFRRAGASWIEHQKLLGFGDLNERFGWSVALDGDWLVIGAPRPSTFCCSTGRVMVYQRDPNGTKEQLSDDTWELVQVLNEDLELCCFGAPVAINDGVLVVGGARAEFDPDTDPGRAYIFEWHGNTWTGPQMIMPSDPRPHDAFGEAVFVLGSSIMVGAPYYPGGGATFAFQRQRGTWVEQKKLLTSEQQSGALFGSSIAMSASTLVVGAPGRNGQRLDEGAAYVFENGPGGWIEKHKLVAWDSAGQYPNFGNRVALHDELVVIAAYDQPWGYTFKLDNMVCSQLETLQGTQGIQRPMRVATDGRFAVVRNHVYAVGPILDLADFGSFQNCMSLEHRQLSDACSELDFESDGAIDGHDFPLFLLTFRGPE